MDSQIKHHYLKINGVTLHVTEAGEGPLVILCHGWPEIWYSWKYQISALQSQGFRVVAPDMRGFGQSDAPEDIAAYTLLQIVHDMVELVEAFGESKAVIIRSDWGTKVAWTAARIRPDIFHAVVALALPFIPHEPKPPIQILQKIGNKEFYLAYFQRCGVAETELERDVALSLRRIFYNFSGDFPGFHNLPMVIDGGGILDNMLEPAELPAWMPESDLDFYINEYMRTGFRGGLNWYRNIDRNWHELKPWAHISIRQPVLFIAGSKDNLIRGFNGKPAFLQMHLNVPGLRRKVLIEGAGHWIQREKYQLVNQLVIEFLREVLPR